MGKLLNTYSWLISNWISGGQLSKRGRMQATDIVPTHSAIFTKSYVKKVYHIVGIKPTQVDMDFVSYLRDQMFDLNPNVELDIIIQNYPVRIDVSSDKFNRRMAKASEAYTTYKEAYDSQSGLARLTGKTYRLPGGGSLRITKERLDDLYQSYVSFVYLYEHLSSGGTVTLTEIYLEISGQNDQEVRRAGEDLYGLVGPLNIGVEEVRGVLKTYLLEHGPACFCPIKLNKKFLPQLLFSEENTTAWTPYRSRGLVSERGLLMGVDFRSRLPLTLDIFSAPSAQVFLICGKTGSGKTYSAFQMAMSALALGETVSAIDIKGREWVKLANALNIKHKVLTFDERNPSFVNTLKLDDLPVTRQNAAELFGTAVRGTIQLLSLIVNLLPDEGNQSDLEMILREAVTKLYSLNGVDPSNPGSFKQTAHLRYSDLLPILENLSTTSSYTKDQQRMVTLARSRCHAYLGDSGIFSENFQNELTLNDIMDSPLVIYEFGKNQNVQTDSLDVLRIFFVQFLDSKKKAALREKGKFIFCFYEELQRCAQFGNLLEFICGETTGARSNNAVIVLLLNSLRVLQGKEAQDIRSNITSFICGSVEQSDVEAIATEFGRPWLASQLDLFRTRSNLYRNCFACDADTGSDQVQTVYKVELPEDMSAKFRTRTIKTDEDWGQ